MFKRFVFFSIVMLAFAGVDPVFYDDLGWMFLSLSHNSMVK